MLETKTLVAKAPETLAKYQAKASEDPKQRRLMVYALALLLAALGLVFYHERDFWFPDNTEADVDQPVESTPVANAAPTRALSPESNALPAKTKRRPVPEAKPAAETQAPPVATDSRTVLPPLEVEVVAGDTHRTIRPGNSSVRVDLQPGAPTQSAADPAATGTTASMTSSAAERVRMSADSSEVISRSVQPNYPLLARQMKVQGSVILQALIGRDGIIQNLHVVSGPPILATAAQDAVRQWHFRPHYQGTEPVETQAKITVNFTISTN